jgi:RNA methyltransferase, TrmH family
LWSAKVVRAAMGAHFALRLHEGVEPRALWTLELPLLGTSSHADEVLGAKPLPAQAGWLIGHEGQGADPLLLSRCERVLRIGQPGGQESLNAAAAAAICMHAASMSR